MTTKIISFGYLNGTQTIEKYQPSSPLDKHWTDTGLCVEQKGKEKNTGLRASVLMGQSLASIATTKHFHYFFLSLSLPQKHALPKKTCRNRHRYNKPHTHTDTHFSLSNAAGKSGRKTLPKERSSPPSKKKTERVHY